MATNIEVIEKIAELSGKVDAQKDILQEVRDLAKESDRALRGYNGNVGLVARVVRNEKILGWVAGLGGLVTSGVIIQKVSVWVLSTFF